MAYLTAHLKGGNGSTTFQHPSMKNIQIYASFDWSHLLKNWRNCMIRVPVLQFPPLDDLNAPKGDWLSAEWKHLQTLYVQQSTQLSFVFLVIYKT